MLIQTRMSCQNSKKVKIQYLQHGKRMPKIREKKNLKKKKKKNPLFFLSKEKRKIDKNRILDLQRETKKERRKSEKRGKERDKYHFEP